MVYDEKAHWIFSKGKFPVLTKFNNGRDHRLPSAFWTQRRLGTQGQRNCVCRNALTLDCPLASPERTTTHLLRSWGTLPPSAAHLHPQVQTPCYAVLPPYFYHRPGTRSTGCILNESCLFDLSSRSDPRTPLPSSAPHPQTPPPPSTSARPAGRRMPGLGGRSWSVLHDLCRAAACRCRSPPCCCQTAAAWDGLYWGPVTGHNHLYTPRGNKKGLNDKALPTGDFVVLLTLTEEFVAVSLFSQHSDDDCIQPLFSPTLQTLKPGLIYFLRVLKMLHVAPHGTSSGAEKQSERRKGKKKKQIEILTYHPWRSSGTVLTAGQSCCIPVKWDRDKWLLYQCWDPPWCF